jgi:hypothetical protein
MNKSMACKWPRSKAAKIRSIIEEMNLCGCGTDAHWVVVQRILDLAAKPHDEREGKGFYQDEWWEFSAKVMDGWGLLEHGGGIGGAWITDDGRLLLEFLRDFGTDDYDMNDDSGQPVWATEFSWEETPKPDDWYAEWEKSLTPCVVKSESEDKP